MAFDIVCDTLLRSVSFVALHILSNGTMLTLHHGLYHSGIDVQNEGNNPADGSGIYVRITTTVSSRQGMFWYQVPRTVHSGVYVRCGDVPVVIDRRYEWCMIFKNWLLSSWRTNSDGVTYGQVSSRDRWHSFFIDHDLTSPSPFSWFRNG